MKPFDLKAALAGAKVVTRDGTKVKIAGYNEEINSLVGWCGNLAYSWTGGGKSVDEDSNLFMAPTERKEWIVRALHISIADKGKSFVQYHGPFYSMNEAVSFCSSVEISSIHEITIHE